MPRDPLAWVPLLQHWTRCLGEGGEAIGRMGDLGTLTQLDLAALMPGGPGWGDVQRCLRHDPEGAFRVLYYGLALRGLEPLPAPELVVPDDSAEYPRISVLIPVHNHWPVTLNCLRSLTAMANGTSFEVILADDASSDATTQLGRQLPWLRIWRSERNQGFLDTCNGAAAVARGEVLLLLNNDTLVGDHALDQIWGSLERHPEAGVVGAAAWGADGRPQEVGGIVWADGQVWNHGRGFPPEHWFALAYERQCDYVSGCALAIRRALWTELGGFDARYRPAYCEDTDLCLRVWESGRTVLVQPRARILHLEGLSHSRDASMGMKQHQLLHMQQLKQQWQLLLDTRQPPIGLPWLLAADRALLGRPLALLMQLGSESAELCRQRGWASLNIQDDWPLNTLLEQLTGPLIPELALVGEGEVGLAIPPNCLRLVDPAELPQRPDFDHSTLPSLPGWEREDLRVLASSSGLHSDGWLERPSRLVIQINKRNQRGASLGIRLYVPEQSEDPPLKGQTLLVTFEKGNVPHKLQLRKGLTEAKLPLPSPAPDPVVIRVEGDVFPVTNMGSDQRQLMAVLAELTIEST